MKPNRVHHSRVAVVLFALNSLCASVHSEPQLGDPPSAPKRTISLPRRETMSLTGGFALGTSSREEVRSFYNAVYTASDGVPMNSTADTATCFAGTNAPQFMDAVLRRINWFRAMAGIPANVTLAVTNNVRNQQAALMMSANDALSHTPPPSWFCFTSDGANAASNSNIALGSSGPDSVTGFINDYGANNAAAGHRRWLLYPQTQIMGTGDVPEQGSFSEANAIWVFDGHFSDARPATRTPYICWPPAGFVPNAVVYPRWSFAHPNANFTNATVTMKSNGIPVSMIALEPLAPGYGENTLVWVPMNLDANDFNTVWPFNGTDTVYTVGVSNVIVTNVVAIVTNFNYTVTVFDPAVPGADYFPPVISGPSQPVVGLSNAYTFNAVSNATSYQWRYTSKTTFSLFDGAEAALANWSTNTSSNYSVIVSSPHPVASGTHAFYLCHTQAASQIMTLNSILYPRTNTTLNFKSELGYATSVQVARVQVSTNGGQSWVDVFSQAGDGGSGETTYSTKNISLASYAGKNLRLRFNYDLAFGGYYPQADVDVGWHFDDVTITNCDQLLTPVTNSTATTNFQFNPPQGGDYNLEVRTLIFTDFPLDWGPTKQVTAIVGSPVMLVNNLASTNNQVRIDFTLQSGSASTFKLLYANQITGGWSTDTLAVLTNVAGSSYRFTTTPGGAMRFYRIQSP